MNFAYNVRDKYTFSSFVQLKDLLKVILEADFPSNLPAIMSAQEDIINILDTIVSILQNSSTGKDYTAVLNAILSQLERIQKPISSPTYLVLQLSIINGLEVTTTVRHSGSGVIASFSGDTTFLNVDYYFQVNGNWVRPLTITYVRIPQTNLTNNSFIHRYHAGPFSFEYYTEQFLGSRSATINTGLPIYAVVPS